MPSFYVAATGNDATGDGSVANPFATLARAQTAMQSNAIKTTDVEGGVYTLTSTLALSAQDDGETFAAAPGQTAIINASGALPTLVSLNSTSDVTLSGLTFENAAVTSGLSTGTISLDDASGTALLGNHIINSGSDGVLMIGSVDSTVSNNEIDNSTRNGIEDQDGGSANVFENNTINGVGATSTSGGGLFLHGTNDETIANNLIENTQGSGITLESVGGYNGDTLYARNTNTLITRNLVDDTSENSNDGGAIYVLDRTGQDTGITIEHNEIDGSGVGQYVGGLYLDDYTSGVTVTGNIVRGVSARDAQLHGGKDDVFSNNIFDLSNVTGFAFLFQTAPTDITPNNGPQSASNDIVNGNIIVSTQTAPIAFIGVSPPKVTDDNNLYYDPNGAFTGVEDIAPHYGDPNFANAAGNDYSLLSGSAAALIGFTAIDQSTIGPIEAAANAPVSVGSGPDAITLAVSEDYYLSNAEFTVSVDGRQVGGLLTTTAIHGEGQSQTFTLNGSFTPGPHTLGVDFTNDAYAGTPTTDRNLYVGAITYNGVTTTENAEQASSGTHSYAVPAGAVTPGSDQLVVNLAEDAYDGNAEADISVDGTQVAGPVTVTALHSAGANQAVVIDGSFGSGPHTVGVTFVNDAYGGTAGTDRNLYVNSVSYDGVVTQVNAVQAEIGTTDVAVAAPSPLGSGPDQLVLDLAEDAYKGNALAVITVGGTQVAGPLAVTTLYSSGQSQVVAIDGAWGSGPHTVGVTFTNDLYGGSPTLDRNLYVTGAAYDGTSVSEHAERTTDGTISFTVSGTTPNATSTASQVETTSIRTVTGAVPSIAAAPSVAGMFATSPSSNPAGLQPMADALHTVRPTLNDWLPRYEARLPWTGLLEPVHGQTPSFATSLALHQGIYAGLPAEHAVMTTQHSAL